MEVSFISLLSHIQLGWWDEEDTPTPQQGCDVEDPSYPTPNGHQQLGVEVTWEIMGTHMTYPHQLSTVESWSGMSNEEDPSCPLLAISSWELKWHEKWWGLTWPTPISYQQLRVKVTWTMRRTSPTPHWPSAVESWSDINSEEDPPCHTPHWSSAVESKSIILQCQHTETPGV